MATQYENPRRLEPRKGTPILPWWRRFVAWAESLPVIVGPNVRVMRTPLGVRVMVRTNHPVRTPFRVSRRALDLRVSVGTVDGEVPWIGDARSVSGENVRLDGTGERGVEPVPVSQVLFRVPADETPARDGDGRSYVVIAAHLKTMREEGLTSPGISPETLRIEHHVDLSPIKRRAVREVAGTVYHTLAVLYWSADRSRIERIGQVAHHHVRLLVDGDGEGFFAAT